MFRSLHPILLTGLILHSFAGLCGQENQLDGQLFLSLHRAVAFQGTIPAGAVPSTHAIFNGKYLSKSGEGEKGEPTVFVDLNFNKGQPEPWGWAYFRPFVAIEHKVQVLNFAYDQKKQAYRLELQIHYRPQLPHVLGGTGKYIVEFKRDGELIDGSYKGQHEPVPQDESRKLWEAITGEQVRQGNPAWPAFIKAGETATVTNLAKPKAGAASEEADDFNPTLVRGRITPHKTPVRTPLTNAEHPRLLFTADLAQLKKNSTQPQGRQFLDALAQTLNQGATGNIAAESELKSDGFEAAGWGLLYRLKGDAQAPDKAQVAAKKVLDTASDLLRAKLGRELMGLAVAYDCCHDRWPAAFRDSVRDFMLQYANRINALYPDIPAQKRKFVFDDHGLVGKPYGAHDYRLAILRAATGMALLAIEGDVPEQQAQEVNDGLQIVERSIRRFCKIGIGENGAGNGNFGFDETIEILLPFLQAYLHVKGKDLSELSGVSRIAYWSIMTNGWHFDQETDFKAGFWLPFSVGFCSPRDLPLARWYLEQHPFKPANPFHAFIALLNYPYEVQAQSPAGRLPLVAEDQNMGSYIFKSGWDHSKDFTTIVDWGSGAYEAGVIRGTFSVYGFGRPIIGRNRVGFGTVKWPERRTQNAEMINAATVTNRKAALPAGGGITWYLEANRNGSGSVSMHASGFRPVKPPFGETTPQQYVDELATCKVRATYAVDYSGNSGAQAVIGMIGSIYGESIGDRERVWELDIGPVEQKDVTIKDDRFLVKLDGNRTLQGFFSFPHTVEIKFQSALNATDNKGGRLLIYRTKPGVSQSKMLEDRADQLLKALEQQELGKEVDLSVLNDLDLVTKEEADERKKREGYALIQLRKLFKHTSSTKMGSPDRPHWAKGSYVCVLTVQDGPPPEISILSNQEDALMQIGPVKMYYREDLIRFVESGTRATAK